MAKKNFDLTLTLPNELVKYLQLMLAKEYDLCTKGIMIGEMLVDGKLYQHSLSNLNQVIDFRNIITEAEDKL